MNIPESPAPKSATGKFDVSLIETLRSSRRSTGWSVLIFAVALVASSVSGGLQHGKWVSIATVVFVVGFVFNLVSYRTLISRVC